MIQVLNERLVFVALVPGILAAIIAVPIAVPIAQAIIRPIAELVEAHRRLARGDKTVRVQPHGRGEVAVLGRSFNSMAETLHILCVSVMPPRYDLRPTQCAFWPCA